MRTRQHHSHQPHVIGYEKVASHNIDTANSIKEIRRAAEAMEASASIAKTHAGIAATTAQFVDRPWLHVKATVLNDPVHVKTTGLALRARITVTNVGRSAAQHVFVVAKMVADEDKITNPMDEITRLMNSVPKNSIGQVVLPANELIREFDFSVPVEDIATVRPTIFGGVRYTHGRATSGLGIPAQFHSTTFGFKIVPHGNVVKRFPAQKGEPEQCHWMPEAITSARDFNYAE